MGASFRIDERQICPPACILYGLSGAGKSTLARELQRSGLARRVRRVSTRAPRSDDDPEEIECVSEIRPDEGDVVLQGWGSDRYLIKRDRIETIRDVGLCPVVELGEYSAVLSVAAAFQPCLVTLVVRPVSAPDLRSLLAARNMTEEEICVRLESLEADRLSLDESRDHADLVLENAGSLVELGRSVALVRERLRARFPLLPAY